MQNVRGCGVAAGQRPECQYSVQERGLEAMLKSDDGTRIANELLPCGRGVLLESKAQVREGLLLRLAAVRQDGRQATPGQGGPKMALGLHEALPSPVGRGEAEIHIQGAKRGSLVAHRKNQCQKLPKRVGTEAAAPERVGGPNSESAAAAVVAPLAIVAENAPAARLEAILIRIIAELRPVKNQGPDRLAMRAGRQFQAFVDAFELVFRKVIPRQFPAQTRSPF